MFQSAGRYRVATISRISSSALETSVPPVAGLWKKVSSSTSSAWSVWRMKTMSTWLVAPRQEHVEQHVEPLGEILHVLGHRAGHVHQAEHHRLGDRLRLVLEAAVADVDRIDVGNSLRLGLRAASISACERRRGAPRPRSRRSPLRARSISSGLGRRKRDPPRHRAAASCGRPQCSRASPIPNSRRGEVFMLDLGEPPLGEVGQFEVVEEQVEEFLAASARSGTRPRRRPRPPPRGLAAAARRGRGSMSPSTNFLLPGSTWSRVPPGPRGSAARPCRRAGC